MKYAVMSCYHEGNTFDDPGEHSIAFGRCTRRPGTGTREADYLVVTLAHLNFGLAHGHTVARENFRVAGVVASVEGERHANERLFELSVHGETTVLSVWEDVCDGAVVGFIMKRLEIPRPADYCLHFDGRKTRVATQEDASFERKNPFQVVPWSSQITQAPSEDELQYVGEEGVVESGTFIPFGVVSECVHGGTAFADVRGTLNLVKVNLCIFGETDLDQRELVIAFQERFLPLCE